MADTVKQVEIPVVKQVVKPVTPTVEPVDPDVAKLSGMLDNYKTALTGRQVAPTQASVAARSLRDATLFLIKNPRRDLFAVFWQFHKDNVDGVCDERRALTGIDNILDVKAKLQTVFMYNTFRAFLKKYTPAVTEKEFTKTIPSANLFRFFQRAR